MTSVLASKQYGNEECLAKLVTEACLTVMPNADSGNPESGLGVAVEWS